MDGSNQTDNDVIRGYLKALLLQLASKSESPGYDLQILMREVIQELHDEVKNTLKKKDYLKLVSIQGSDN